MPQENSLSVSTLNMLSQRQFCDILISSQMRDICMVKIHQYLVHLIRISLYSSLSVFSSYKYYHFIALVHMHYS